MFKTRPMVFEVDGAPEPRILVFAGAGASVAVSKEYPTTHDFFMRLPENITKDDTFVLLQRYLKEERQLRTLDIEALLWTLQEARNTFKALVQDSPSAFLLTHGANKFSVNRGHVVHPANTLLPHLENLEGAINAQIYDYYSREPEAGDALDVTWLPLLKELTSIYRHVDLFTTNYDCILEHVIDEGNLSIDTGRRGKTYPRLDLEVWKSETRASTPLLTKLHGSVHWRWRGGAGKAAKRTIAVGDPSFSGAHPNHVVIYPGFKGTPTEEPFRTFHAHFADCVREAAAIVFIGFAFRDEHLNTVLATELRKDAVLVAVDPKEQLWTEEPSWARGITHVQKPFGREAVDEILGALASVVRPMRANEAPASGPKVPATPTAGGAPKSPPSDETVH